MAGIKEIPFRHIAVDGLLRSGKTQLANVLAKRIGGRIILDRTDNPYLKDFYEEKEGAAFLSQLVFLVNRYHQQSSLMQRSLFDERIICDYIFEKDKVYAYQTLTDEELVVYEKIYTIFAERIVRPDLAIYLQVSMPTLLKRIAKEGTDLEKNISEKYIEDILEAYDYFFFNYQSTPLLVVKADHLDFSRDEDVEDLVEKMIQMKKDTLYYVPLGKKQKDADR
ncbi:MAG: deoxynucleoside kinase [Candidatus Aminicenantes bacterium]|nr:deoxynucleoside kinase [Candidatus Aminicenantes bacterium]